MGSPADGSLDATLRARGLTADLAIALDATITPATLLGASARPPTAPSAATLPRISLSFPGDARASVAPASDRAIEVLSLLGEGGMGSVYLARERTLDREVAVKTTRDVASDQGRAALCAEAVITGHLEHPGVVPIHQLATAPDGRPVLVMKRIEGTSWRTLLADPDHRAWADVRVRDGDRRAFHLEVLGRVCDALAFAHSRGIVHRDLKPENVMVGAFGEVYLVDWGIAARVGERDPAETLVGTPLYMAPEMVLGGAIDPRTDVYLLGATLLEVLTGAPPHRGDTVHEVLLSAVEAAPPVLGPEVPSDLAELCRRALAKDPAARPADARAFGDALADHARHRASRALTARADERLAELRERVTRPIAEGDRPLLYRLLAECRFGYLEAQREWPENDRVPGGLAATIEAGVEIELSRRDAAGARALPAELPSPSAALEARIAELEREKERERLEAERLQKLAEGSDTSASPGLRVVLGVLGIAVTGTVSFFASRQAHTAEGITVADAFRFSLATSGMLILGIATFGRRLFAQAFNRRLATWALISAAALIANRAIALGGGTTVRALLAHDMVLIGVCFAFGALLTFRMLALGTVIMLGGAAIATLFPEAAETVFSTFGVASMVLLGITFFRARRAPTRA